MTTITIFGVAVNLNSITQRGDVSITAENINNNTLLVVVTGKATQMIIFDEVKFKITVNEAYKPISVVGVTGQFYIKDTLIDVDVIIETDSMVLSIDGQIGFRTNKLDLRLLMQFLPEKNPHYPLSEFLNLENFSSTSLEFFPKLHTEEEISILRSIGTEPPPQILEWKNDYKRELEDSDSNKIKQAFAFHSAHLNATKGLFTIVYQPTAKGIYLSPDILDPKNSLVENSNSFLYQHIALECNLESRFGIDTNSDCTIDEWALTPKDGNGLILATPALRDENGYPLVLRVEEKLQLILRGTRFYCGANEEMNMAIVPGGKNDVKISCKMVSFMPMPNQLPSSPNTLNNDRYIKDPPWVKFDTAQKPPREINGWSRNAVIRLPRAGGSLACRLDLRRIKGNNSNPPSYVLATIDFPADHAKLLVDLPDKESDSIDSDTSHLIQRLEGGGKSGKNITLPLCDTSWAFADLSGTDQETVGDSNTNSFAFKISEILFNLNNDLVEAFEKPAQSKYQHIEGHRAETPVQAFEQLLSVPPISTAASSNSGERNWMALAPSETTLKAASVEANSPSGTVFLFGGNKDNDSFDFATRILSGVASEEDKISFHEQGFFPLKLPQWQSEYLPQIRSIWITDKFNLFRSRYGAFLSLEVLQKIKEDKEFSDEFERILKNNRIELPRLSEWNAEFLGKVIEIWSRDSFKSLRDRYGEHMNHAVLQKINEARKYSYEFFQLLKSSGINLNSLDELIRVPDYLVLSAICHEANSQGVEDQLKQLKELPFDFCKLSKGKQWTMKFEDDVTFIVKLGGDRSLKDILAELSTTYRKPDKENPFKLQDGLEGFIAQLHPELLVPTWRGVLVVNPQIELDESLHKLCNKGVIKGSYAAITGHTNKNSKIDVWGRIDQRAQTQDNNNSAECSWALVKFEATIKNTTILAGEIQFRLRINELLGKKIEGEKQDVDVIGTLKATESNQPRDFSFAATLSPPREYIIDTFFLEKVMLHSVKIGTYNGQTALDIDADLKLKKFEPILNEPPKDPLKLTNFHILLPAVDVNKEREFGQWVNLAFDLGGIRVSLPEKSEKLNIKGFQIKPAGIGMLKDKGSKIIQKLNEQTIPLIEPQLDESNYSYPYLDTLVEFGNDPDPKGENQLSFTLRSGATIPNNDNSYGLGLASLQGKDIKLSLFGFVTVSAARVEAKSLGLKDPDDPLSIITRNAAVVLVEQFNLGILSWNLFDDNEKRTLIFAQVTDRNPPDPPDSGKRGVLGWYANTPPVSDSKFFQLHWLLLARNFDPGKNIKNALLSQMHDAEKLGQILNGILNGNDLSAKIYEDDSWLFGIAFSLGSLFKDCAFVLHEKRYYGIRLGGPIAKALTGEDVIALAYIPGEKPELSRFRTEFRCPALDMIGKLRSGLMAMEWSPNWDFVLDFGFPWRVREGYEWSRAFAMPVGVYEAQFGYFIERRTTLKKERTSRGGNLTLSAGAGFYLGYKYEAATKLSWVRAGIGIYGVLIGSATLALPSANSSILKGSLTELSVTGALGIYAYGEAGVDLWVITARFKVSAQASVTVELVYNPSRGGLIIWNATLSASYSARVTIGCGFVSKTVTKSGSLAFAIQGQADF
jgi:hypothetical protein